MIRPRLSFLLPIVTRMRNVTRGSRLHQGGWVGGCVCVGGLCTSPLPDDGFTLYTPYSERGVGVGEPTRAVSVELCAFQGYVSLLVNILDLGLHRWWGNNGLGFTREAEGTLKGPQQGPRFSFG